MRTTTTLLLGALMGLSAAQAQNLGEIHGKVFDDQGTPLFMANVVTDGGGGLIGTTTDDNGRFVLKPLKPGTYTVRVSYVGMITSETSAIRVNPDKITILDDQLLVSNLTLPMIEVIANKWMPRLIDAEEPSRITIVASQFKKNPLLKNPVSMIASISSDIYKSPNSDELYFRGSRSGSMAYYIDGVKVTSGLSGVPPGSMASITIYTGGLPARYGDVTGGVVAIETKSYYDLYMQEKAGVR